MANGSLTQHRGGSGEPLLLVHGLGSSWQAFAPVLEALEARHDVIAPDMPGFGASPPFPDGTTPTVGALADSLEGELDALGVETPHVVGNSLGGWVALELARRGRAKTVCAMSPGGLASKGELRYAVGSLTATYALASRLAPKADVLTRTAAGRTALFAQVIAKPWRMSAEDAAQTLRTLGEAPGFKPTMQWTLAHEQASGLGEIKCPTVIAWGTQDRLLLPRQAQRFVDAIPGAELRKLPGAGHVPMIDDPDAVARTILELTAAGERAEAASSTSA